MRENTYREYIADSLHFRGQNKYLVHRLKDILDPTPVEPPMTQEQIIEKLKKGGITIT